MTVTVVTVDHEDPIGPEDANSVDSSPVTGHPGVVPETPTMSVPDSPSGSRSRAEGQMGHRT